MALQAVIKPKACERKRLRKDLAAIALSPAVNAGAVVQEFTRDFGSTDIHALVSEVEAAIFLLKSGDLGHIESMLLSQAIALQSVFTGIAHRAGKQQHLRQWDALMRVALKAQNQCRMTLETLAMIKNPATTVIAKQANITTGPQQVNNGLAELTNQPEPSKLLEPQNGHWMDPRETSATGNTYQVMEAVGAL